MLALMCVALVLASGAALAATIRGNEGDNRLVGTSKSDTIYSLCGVSEIYGGSGDDFIEAVDGREDFVDCGRLESPVSRNARI